MSQHTTLQEVTAPNTLEFNKVCMYTCIIYLFLRQETGYHHVTLADLELTRDLPVSIFLPSPKGMLYYG